MVVLAQLNGDHICYEVDQVDNFNDFLYWLMYKVDEEECNVSYNGYLFHFKTVIERQQFALGFRVAWEAIDDKYLQNSNRSNPCPSDCVVNGSNPERSEMEPQFMKMQ